MTMTNAPRFASFMALVWLEARLLWRNRGAWMVLLALLAMAALLGRREARRQAGPEGVCYILTWRDDDWADRLRREAAAQTLLPIIVAPVEQFTGDDGIISYPEGTHSIQVRPAPQGDAADWVIWCWYSGSDAAALAPFEQWFWRITQEHFQSTPRFDQRLTALRPMLELPVAPGGPPLTRGLIKANWFFAPVVWFIIFHAAMQLPALSLAQHQECRGMTMIQLSPAASEAAIAHAVFHAGLAVATVCIALPFLRTAAIFEGNFWFALLGGTIAYLGAAVLLANVQRESSAVSGSLMLYLLLASAWAAVAWLLVNRVGWRCGAVVSLEYSVGRLLHAALAEPALSTGVERCAIVGWAALGVLALRAVCPRLGR